MNMNSLFYYFVCDTYADAGNFECVKILLGMQGLGNTKSIELKLGIDLVLI